MDRLYEGERLSIALADARRRTLAIYSHLDLASLQVPCMPIVNPPLWELAHIAWFQEFWCLRGGDDADRSILERADALFNSTHGSPRLALDPRLSVRRTRFSRT